MSGYERQNVDWESGDMVTEENFDAWDQAIYELKNAALDVTAFGAVGDGTTNNTTAVQDAVDAAEAEATASSPRAVKFPEGKYKLVPDGGNLSNNTYYAVRLKANVHLYGEGNAVIYHPYVAGFSPDQQSALHATGIDNFSVRNMVFDGGATAVATEKAHYGIYAVSDCNDFRIVDNEFFGAQGKAVHVDGTPSSCNRFWIADNYFHHQGHGNAIGHNSTCNEYFIVRNLIVDSYAPGGAEAIIADSGTHERAYIGQNMIRAWGDIQLPGLTDSRVVGNTVILDGSSGAMKVANYNVTRTLIADNYLDLSTESGSDNHAIRITESSTVLTDVVVARNIIRMPSADADGIRISPAASTGVKIEGNRVIGGGVGRRAIIVGNVTGLQVLGNYLSRELNVASTCSNAIVADNIVTGTGSMVRVDAPDSTVRGNVCPGDTADGAVSLYIAGDRSQIIGNRISHATGNNSPALYLEASNCLVSGNWIRHTFNTDQGRIIEEPAGENNNYIVGNYGYGTPSIVKNGAATVVRRNRGYVTENRGSASLQNGSSVTHGLSTTPTTVRVTGSVAKRIIGVTALAASTFTVSMHDDTGAAISSPETVYWEAEV